MRITQIKSERSLRRHRTNGAKFYTDYMSLPSDQIKEFGLSATYEQARNTLQTGEGKVYALYDEDTKATASDGATKSVSKEPEWSPERKTLEEALALLLEKPHPSTGLPHRWITSMLKENPDSPRATCYCVLGAIAEVSGCVGKTTEIMRKLESSPAVKRLAETILAACEERNGDYYFHRSPKPSILVKFGNDARIAPVVFRLNDNMKLDERIEVFTQLIRSIP